MWMYLVDELERSVLGVREAEVEEPVVEHGARPVVGAVQGDQNVTATGRLWGRELHMGFIPGGEDIWRSAEAWGVVSRGGSSGA